MNFSEAKKNLNYETAIRIGKLLKTHANKGQLSAKIFVDIDLIKVESIFVEINKYLVPFFIDYDNSNFNIYPQIIKLRGIETLEDAKKFSFSEIFLPHSFIREIEQNISDFGNFIISFDITNKKQDKKIGKIISFNEELANPLLEIENNDGKNILLPLNSIEEIEMDIEKKEIRCNIPPELLEL